jgi:hypothetical protein
VTSFGENSGYDVIEHDDVCVLAKRQQLCSSPPSASHHHRRAILMISVSPPEGTLTSGRPWLSFVASRVQAYGDKVEADVHIVTTIGETCLADFAHAVEIGMDEPYDLEVAYRWCSMRSKLIELERLLRIYESVLVVDDTIVLRRDTVDLFAVTGPGKVGGVLEGKTVRSEASKQEFVDAACEFYGFTCASAGSFVVNTGFYIIPSSAVDVLFPTGAKSVHIDMRIYGDQGYVNAVLNANSGLGVVDWGYSYNYVGSFLNINAHKMGSLKNPLDAFAVHATTGLLVKELEQDEDEKKKGVKSFEILTGDAAFERRKSFMEGVDEAWRERGV